MLVIISDIHLKDGTSGTSITPDAFRIFADRLQDIAIRASWRSDGTYRPIEGIDLVLLGDVFDHLLSSQWHRTDEGDPVYVYPWHDPQSPALVAKIHEITRGILSYNAESFSILKNMSKGKVISLPPATAGGRPADKSTEHLPVKVRIHQMVGNHDWYFHLPGEAYDAIRGQVVETLGLANPPSPFPHDPSESPELMKVFRQHHVFARHGDIYDPMNFNKEAGRDCATLGDALASELLTRFPLEVQKRLGDQLPEQFSTGLRELTNVRPALVIPLWISSLVRTYAGSKKISTIVKAVWDELSERFLELEFVRSQDRFFKADIVDALQSVLFLTQTLSFDSINRIMGWANENIWDGHFSFSGNVPQEAAYIDQWTNFFVYGHTHFHETVPLDSSFVDGKIFNQIYINAGTWHTFHDLTKGISDPRKFIAQQVMTFLIFFNGDERNGRPFESWSGSLSTRPM